MTAWRKRQIQELKMEKEEFREKIKEEIAELYGFSKALGQAIQLLQKQHQEATRQYFEKCTILKDLQNIETIFHD
jgi:predicted HicB family RNase H-like nuclease